LPDQQAVYAPQNQMAQQFLPWFNLTPFRVPDFFIFDKERFCIYLKVRFLVF